MQVRKFEAKTMKDALVMVKNSLGPDAIILSAKSKGPGFGLSGQKSIEVTAAISENILRKKQIAEKKLNEQNKQKYNQISAKKQKEFIDKVFTSLKKENDIPRSITSTRYIDIDDDSRQQTDEITVSHEEKAKQRIQNAAKEALQASYFVSENDELVKVQEKAIAGDNDEILRLKNEIAQLKGLINQFQKVPQSFVTMHPGANEGVPYELSFMFEKLTRSGISIENAVEILDVAKSSLSPAQLKKHALIDAWVAKYILDKIIIADNRVDNRYHAFVGPTGQGKTSSLVKFASHLVICERKKIAIVTTDNMKVGAKEQLKIYAQILNVPFCVVGKPSDWEQVDDALKDCDHILVDYPGLALKTMGELDKLRSMLPPTTGGRSIHYVQSVKSKDSDAFEVAKRYQPIGFTDVIFNSLDESIQHGLIYNFQKQFGTALHSFGLGPKIPEDFEAATKERVVDLLFKLTKIKQERGQ